MAIPYTYLIVDWSASNTPKTGKDSIWYSYRGVTRNPPTRARAMAEITAIARAETGPLLIGFDFPLGFPVGFASRLGLAAGGGVAGWYETWQELDRLIEDGSDNGNNRFAAASLLNKRLTGGAAPFWGCPARYANAYLLPTQPPSTEAALPFPCRLTERRGAKPAWKLAYPGTCGSQALLGIPRLLHLRRALPEARVWPFETGLREPGARLVIAEIYPSLLSGKPGAGDVKDEWQVRTLAALFAAERPDFAPRLTAEQRGQVEQEEGWILGIGALP